MSRRLSPASAAPHLLLLLTGCAANPRQSGVTTEQLGAAVSANIAAISQVQADVNLVRQKIERVDATIQGLATGQVGLVNAVGQIGNRTTTNNFDQVTLWLIVGGSVIVTPFLTYVLPKLMWIGVSGRRAGRKEFPCDNGS